MDKLKKGDEVLILEDTEFYYQAPGIVGIVVSEPYNSRDYKYMWVKIKFPQENRGGWLRDENGIEYSNSYPAKDLILVKPKEKPLPNLNRKILDIMNKR